MMLIRSVFLSTILNCILATDFPLPVPPPFNPQRVGFPRAPVGIFKPGPMMHLGPRLPPRQPTPRNNMWFTKFRPNIGPWVKVKKRPNVINPKLRHHLAKKAHLSKLTKINKLMRLRKRNQMNIVRSRIFPRKYHGRRYKNYNKIPRRIAKIRPQIRSNNFVRQGLAGGSHPPFNRLHISRQRMIPRKNERFHHDNEFFDDLNDEDQERFRGIHNSFDDRFHAGFRNNYRPNQDSVSAGVRGQQFDVTKENIQRPVNPPVRRIVNSLQHTDYYHKQNNIPKYETFSLGGNQARMLNPGNKIKNSLNTAIHGAFDRKDDSSFVGMTDTRGTSFNGMHGGHTQHFITNIGSRGDASTPGIHQNGFSMNSADVTNTMTQLPLFNDRVLNTPIASNPGNDIRFPSTGVASFTVDNRLPDGLLHDFHDVKNLDGIDDIDDHIPDHKDDHHGNLNDRLDFDGSFNHDDHSHFDVHSDDRLDLDDGHHNTFPQIPHVQNRVHNDFLDRPHIAQASDTFERDNEGFDHDNGHHGHDDSPIDGLELLGSSRWSDVISELTNAGSHNHIFDQVPRENVPVFPVNPHVSAGPSVHGEHIMMENGNNDMGPGTLALLGIDPMHVATADNHPPPFPIPESFETIHEKNSINSIPTENSVVITKNDDSVTTVVTKQPIKISRGIESNPTTSSPHGSGPTLDISKAAEQFAMFGALDNLDFGNDSFDEDLKL